jgi:hypothetical protein
VAYKNKIRFRNIPVKELLLTYMQQLILLGALDTLIISDEVNNAAQSTAVLADAVMFQLDKYKAEELSFNPEILKNRIESINEKEKAKIIKELDTLKKENEDMFMIEKMKKRLGIGKWAVGGTKVIYAYDKDYYDLELENLVLLENESNLTKKITNLTLLDLFDYLDQISLYGRLTPEDFLLKIKEGFIAWNDEKINLIPSLMWTKHYNKYNKWCWFYTDSFNQWHFLDNSGLVKEVLELNKLPQSKIFSFIEILVSPEVRREEDAKILLESINEFRLFFKMSG